ncbi:MAG: SEC-C metal-binding domain-containing protein, partial [Sulfuricella sp.]
MKTPGRNTPCPCGSGKKYKQCCSAREEAQALNVPQTLQAALAHHQAGRLLQAEEIYQQILQAEPNHPEALHLLGMLA